MAQERENERVVGVFPDEQAAEEAARAARAAGAEEVHVGGSQDEVAALRSEMREEGAEARPGFYTPDMARTVPLWTAIFALAGVIVALPFGFREAGDVPLVTRLVVVAVTGAVIGGTIGFIFGLIVGGGFLGRRRKGKSDLAAERGVVVGAKESTSRVTPTLGGRDPIRVDKVAPSGQPEDTVTTEGRKRQQR